MLFKAPKRSFNDIKPETAAELIVAASDVALVLDAKGVIRDVAVGSDDLASDDWSGLIGAPWAATVTTESREKVVALLRAAASGDASRWRQVNQLAPSGEEVPISYAVVPVSARRRAVAVGRNLQPVALLQRRLVDAQQSLERDYARLRHAETRFRMLFHAVEDAVLVIDATGQLVAEANPMAAQLFGRSVQRLVGARFPLGLDPKSEAAVEAALAGVRSHGREETLAVQLGRGGARASLRVALFRQEHTNFFLVRLRAVAQADGASADFDHALLALLDGAPDGFVVTDQEGRVERANRAFLELAEVPTEEQSRGVSLDRWIGRPGVELELMLATLRQQRSLRLFATTLRGVTGGTVDVEISGAAIAEGDKARFGFIVRGVGGRLASTAAPALPRKLEQLTGLIGRMPLKEIVRETTDVIERLCIEAALELARDNRALAAEMLGVSRQSLYVKLRRHNLGDLDPA